jgi:glycosyltransferase involved in cell wall biosynthesis
VAQGRTDRTIGGRVTERRHDIAVFSPAKRPTANDKGKETRPMNPSSTAAGAPTEAPRVSVVIPALNEAKNLPHVFSALPSDLYEIILVDGNSTDGTAEVARALFPAVRVVGQTGRGKGDALACGLAACQGDIAVTLDADGSTKPDEIPRFVEALRDGFDFAKGSRFLAGGGTADMSPLRRVGNHVLTGTVNVLFGTSYTDLCYGYNALWTRCLGDIDLDCDGFEVETLMNVRAAKAGLRVIEVPSYEERRIHGTSNLRTFRDGFRVLRTIVRERFSRQPQAEAPEPAEAPAQAG